MPRVKAIFDADILIHLIRTDSLKYALDILETVFISDYVYDNEIKKNTPEGKIIEKLYNQGKLKRLTYESLTTHQKKIFRDTDRILKEKAIDESQEKQPVNDGERRTAAFAKACDIYYYMSDDNKAAPYIRSLASVEIINFCDILFLYINVHGKKELDTLQNCYVKFTQLYEDGKEPKIIKKDGKVLPFIEVIRRSYIKFASSENLKRLMDNIVKNNE